VQALNDLQYEGPLELIVVVDGSTDGTADALRQLQTKCTLRIIEQANAGAGAARNSGAAVANGEILLFLDDDMICEPDLVEQHAQMYRDGADALIGDILLDPWSPPGFISEGIAGWLRSCRVGSRLTPFDIFTAQLSVRKEVFEQIGGFDPSLTAGAAFAQEDADFGVKLLAAFDVRYNPSAVSRLRYAVTPREQMQRTAKKAVGDLLFSLKYPRLSHDLWEMNGAWRPATRFIYRPLSRIPLLPSLLGELATRAAEAGLKTNLRSNRLLARFFNTARAVSYWAAVLQNGDIPNSRRLLILCYHAIEDHRHDPVLSRFSVRRQLFEAQLDSLIKRGFVFVGPDALAAFVAGAPLPHRSVLLTFDDCYSELPAIVREVLQPRQIKAIAFVVTSVSSNEWDQQRGSASLPLLSGNQLRDLPSQGVEIGCHSRTHRDLRLLSNDELLTETAGAAQDLVEAGLPRPRFFAYPYGACDTASREAVREAGYVAALGLSQRYANSMSDPFDLPRIMILADDRGWRFRLRTALPLLFAHARRWLPGV
jgi:peptidoglycan/xylan/chitin deacetylase (PgdA/CDA1 family)/glycosyltransferase involved in cell wall biosynthesis